MNKFYIKNGILRNKKLYKCKNCNYQFIGSNKHDKSEILKLFALLFYLSSNINSISYYINYYNIICLLDLVI